MNLNLITALDTTGYGYTGRFLLSALHRCRRPGRALSADHRVFLSDDPQDPVRLGLANAGQVRPGRAERPDRLCADASRACRPRQARRVSHLRARSI